MNDPFRIPVVALPPPPERGYVPPPLIPADQWLPQEGQGGPLSEYLGLNQSIGQPEEPKPFDPNWVPGGNVESKPFGPWEWKGLSHYITGDRPMPQRDPSYDPYKKGLPSSYQKQKQPEQQSKEVPTSPKGTTESSIGELSRQMARNEIDQQAIAAERTYGPGSTSGLGLLEAAKNRYGGAIKKYADAEEKIAADRQRVLGDVASASKDAADALENSIRAHNEAKQPILQKLDAWQNELRKEVNPNRYRDSQSAGQVVLSSIALVLGGIGAGLTGGPNPVAETIQKSIDNDIRSQLEQKDGLRSIISDARASLGQMADDFKSESSLIDAWRIRKMDAAKVELEALADKSKGNEIGMLAEQGLFGMEEKIAKAKNDLASNTANFLLESMKIGTKGQITLPQGMVWTGPPLSKEEWTAVQGKLRENHAGYMKFRGALDKVQEFRKEHPKGTINLKDRDIAEGLVKDVLDAGRQYQGSGASFTEAEMKLLETKSPATLEFFFNRIGPELDSRIKRLEENYSNSLGAYNLGLAASDLDRRANARSGAPK